MVLQTVGRDRWDFHFLSDMTGVVSYFRPTLPQVARWINSMG